MIGTRNASPPLATLAAAALLCGPGSPGAGSSTPVPWDIAFADGSGNLPVHFVAHYVDGHGTSHRLEEWRVGQQHLRRKTDDRIDLHADASPHPLPGQPADYEWQILDLQKRIAHRVSTAGMLHLGMLYSYYAMAHLLTRPAGQFRISPAAKPVPAPGTAAMDSLVVPPQLPPCTWWQIDAPGQRSSRVCWVARYGLPAETWSESPDGWRLASVVERFTTRPIPAEIFRANTAGFQVRNVDEIEAED